MTEMAHTRQIAIDELLPTQVTLGIWRTATKRRGYQAGCIIQSID
jgi:hypothetical protein